MCDLSEVYERNEKLYLSSCCRPYGRYLGADLYFNESIDWARSFSAGNILASFPDSLYGHLAYFSPKTVADNWKDEFWMFLGGMTGGSFYFFTENTALEITLATNVSFIVCTAPLLTTILSLWIYKKEKATRGLIGGSLLALVGVALVVYNGSFVLKISPLGDFLTLLAAFSWAFYSLIMRKMSNRYGITFITRKIFFYGVLTILPAFLVHPWQFDIARLLEPAILFNLLFLGVLASLICFVVWNVILKQLGTIRASNYIYLNPLFTLIGSAFLLGERLTMVALMGAVLILGGVYWAGKR